MQSRNQVANEALIQNVEEVLPHNKQTPNQSFKLFKNPEGQMGGEDRVQKSQMKSMNSTKNIGEIGRASTKRAAALEKMVQSIREKKFQRKEQNAFWYVFTLFITLLLGAENLYIYLWENREKDLYLFFPTLIIRIPFLLAGTWYLCKQFKTILKFYFCFDKVLVTTAALSIAQVGFYLRYMPFTDYKIYYEMQCFFYPLAVFVQAGYYRIVLTHAKWSKCQTILMKIMLLLGGTSCFTLGLYYSVSQTQFTNGQDEALEKSMREFLFLFAFAGFDFYLESFALMDDSDGTSQCRANYQLKSFDEFMQTIIITTIKKTSSIKKDSRPPRQIQTLNLKKIDSGEQLQE